MGGIFCPSGENNSVPSKNRNSPDEKNPNESKFREICSTEVKVTQYDKIFITDDMIKEWSIIPGTFLLLKEMWVEKSPENFYFFFHWSH